MHKIVEIGATYNSITDSAIPKRSKIFSIIMVGNGIHHPELLMAKVNWQDVMRVRVPDSQLLP